MSKINLPTIGIDDFVQNHFLASPKNILVWDTCSLLDIMRLPYRNGDLTALQSLIEIKNLIDSNTIFSLCSSLTMTEWNDNEDNVKQGTQKSLELTSIYHKNCVEIINNIFTTPYQTTQLDDKGLVGELEKIADEILNKSIYLNTDTISDSALWRVAQKRAPASKKQEFKDCAIWETALAIGSAVNGNGKKVIYFTVNTDDYIDKSRTPKVPYSSIISEAVSMNVDFTLTFQDAHTRII
jgi:hypothetical protein